MNTSRSFPVFAVVFAVVWAVTYVIAVQKNYALFTYHPALEEFGLLVEKPKEGPAMYWYGWLATAGIAALAAGLIACFVPERVTQRLWSGWSWTIPLGVMLVFGYLLKGYFLR
ncbi:MAG TPA: hypothetical protein VMO00_00305 [Methylomirabilota bacterium]|nr:hypothetical protein [Methylomirabilota bacterium]